VPCVYENGKGVFESGVLLEWLEDRFPSSSGSPALLPSDPAERAAARLLIAQLSVAPFYAFMMEQDRSKDAAHVAACDGVLSSVEARMTAQSSGPFFLGEQLSIADCALLPFIYRFSIILGAARGYAFLDHYPRIKAALEAALKRPAFQKTAPPAEFIIQAYSGYLSGTPGVPQRVKPASAK
jgi:glutathione S-transferase